MIPYEDIKYVHPLSAMQNKEGLVLLTKYGIFFIQKALFKGKQKEGYTQFKSTLSQKGVYSLPGVLA